MKWAVMKFGSSAYKKEVDRYRDNDWALRIYVTDDEGFPLVFKTRAEAEDFASNNNLRRLMVVEYDCET